MISFSASNFIIFSGLVFLGLSLWCIQRVRNDFLGPRGELSIHTALLVWIVYLLHLLLVIVSAWRGMWAIAGAAAVWLSLGVLVILLGIIFGVLSLGRFHSLRLMSGVDNDRLVTTGIYRFSRNPQNVGWILISLGISLLGRSGFSLLLVCFFVVVYRVYLGIEERFLEQTYGDDYRRYRGQTPRFLGWSRESE